MKTVRSLFCTLLLAGAVAGLANSGEFLDQFRAVPHRFTDGQRPVRGEVRPDAVTGPSAFEAIAALGGDVDGSIED
jgi:hypothetical protein